MLDILFLGTGASLPSRDRSPPCIALRGGSDIILFDCGEGSQRQMMISPFSFMKVTGIFITHLHGDHVFGLPGLLQTMGISGRKDPLIVCGPSGFKKALEMMLSVCEGQIDYPLDIRELEAGDVVGFKDLTVSCFSTMHNIPSLGYVLKEKDQKGKFDKDRAIGFGLKPSDYGKLQDGQEVNGITPDMVMGPPRPGLKVVYSGDTTSCDQSIDAAIGADLLIHESTYCESESALAAKHFHSTSKQAALIAKKAECKNLILVHISNRYEDRKVVENEAREIFQDSYIADDLQLYRLNKSGLKLV
jgi:ribonuclease Z